MSRRFAPFQCFLIAALVAAPASLAAQTLAPDTAARVDAVFARFSGAAPGCAVNLLRDDKSLYAKGYGLASLELGVPISPRSIFDLGSTSKQFTAMSVLLLAQDGKLSLDDDIRKFIPELPDLGARVTLRHLLTHTSGWRDYVDLMVLQGWDDRDHSVDRDALDPLRRQRALNFAPGTDWRYSNTGYFLMSLVVRRASGKSLADFARERIFEPLGMRETHYLTDSREVIPNKATAYSPAPGGKYAIDMSDWEQIGDGGIQSSVEELARWDANFTSGTVGGRALLEQLQTPATLANGTPLQYALGLTVDRYRGLPRISHGGAWGGFRAMTMRFPAQRLSVLLTCNRADANTMLLATNVANVFLPAAAPAPTLAGSGRPGPAAAGDAARFAGMYLGQSGEIALFSARGDTLFVGAAPRATALVPLGAGRFRNPVNQNEQQFAVDRGSRRLTLIPVAGGLPDELRGVESIADTSAAALAEYVGSYTSPEMAGPWELVLHEQTLMLHRDRGDDDPLRPVFRDGFGGPGLVQFERDAKGRVRSLVLYSRGLHGLRMTRR
jgi:CubicO group peptidase (beta-lactamase class C family)